MTIIVADVAHAQQPDIPSAYVVAAEDHGVPPAVLYAVASAESVVRLDAGRRPWPWTLNVAGTSMRFGDRSSACQALTDALETTQIVDVGIAQLNVRWQPQLFGAGQRFADPCEGLDPYANLDEAAALIRGHFDDAGDWLIAAGRYHRPAGGRPAERYRAVVSQELARLGTSPTLEIGSSARIAARQTSRPTRFHRSEMTSVESDSLMSPDEALTWVSPGPRTPDSDVTWITPERRPWIAEVALR
ncbi:lytic transglycosylase domain-containing protein [Halomonas dongshanensis]|uniref:Lytic transglycosylase domain-containing protein n=1 Tax=Halomonas dongshanensis TaxID=2890835 RepID=A0ABT2EHJ8_9GAMM|nr:lytic transglycosylase domain-containing protein [Halomonas dongshanensis]MCS2611050.1 lytic transglycosylase domain-containing protein [Halomonas dongshanensis]